MKKEKNLLIGIILGICGMLFIMMSPHVHIFARQLI